MKAGMRVLAGLAMLFAAQGTRAQESRLGIASSAPVTSIDPHYHTFTPNDSMAAHIYDRLVGRDATGKLIPGLAVSWKIRDERTWEFKLRDTKFHDGTPFVAEDVAYTLNRVPRVKNSPASYAIYTKAVISTEIVDAHTILLRTDGPYPLLATDLTYIAILPHLLGADPATEDFNSGKNAIGTGPYRFLSFKPGDRVELERNDSYWGTAPAWKNVTYRIIGNDAARTAALLAGDVGIIEFVPPNDLPSLRANKNIRLAEVVSNRSIYLWLDHAHEGATPFVTGPKGEILDKNPL